MCNLLIDTMELTSPAHVKKHTGSGGKISINFPIENRR